MIDSHLTAKPQFTTSCEYVIAAQTLAVDGQVYQQSLVYEIWAETRFLILAFNRGCAFYCHYFL
jgi:hypothetical protein